MASDLRRHLAVVVLVVSPVSGCTGAPPGTEGDCNARIGYDDVIYRPHNALNQAAPRGELLGTGDVLDCDGDPVPEYGTVDVFSITGVDPSVAVRTGSGEFGAVYIAEGTPRPSWPPVLEPR